MNPRPPATEADALTTNCFTKMRPGCEKASNRLVAHYVRSSDPVLRVESDTSDSIHWVEHYIRNSVSVLALSQLGSDRDHHQMDYIFILLLLKIIDFQWSLTFNVGSLLTTMSPIKARTTTSCRQASTEVCFVCSLVPGTPARGQVCPTDGPAQTI